MKKNQKLSQFSRCSKSMLVLTLFMTSLLFSSNLFAATYYWVGGTTSAAIGAIGTVSSVSLGGTANASLVTFTSSDILIFDGSDISSTAGLQTGTITFTQPAGTLALGQMIFQNNATVIYSSTSSRTFNISGSTTVGADGTADDFVIGSGSSFTTTGSAITINLLTGATGSVTGSLFLGAGSNNHIITSADANGLVFKNNSNCTINASTNNFGTTTQNSVIFNSGATLTVTKSSDPFGGNKVITMQNGSTYVFGSSTSGSLILNGNTFGNLTINTNAAPPTGATGFTINGNLTLNANLTIAATGTSNHIKGNINIVSGILNLNPTSVAGTINLSGSTAQTITNTGGTFTTAALGTWSVSNTTGVSLGANLAISAGTLTVVSGGIFNFSTFVLSGAGTFSVASGGTLKTSNTNGFGSSITTTTKTLNTGAKYEWNANTTTAFGSLTINTPADLTVNRNVTLDKPVSMTGVLTFGTGKLTTSATNLLTLGSASTISGASSNGFVVGPLAHTIASSSQTSKVFPIGKGSNYSPLTLTITQSAATSTTYTAEAFAATPTARTLTGSLTAVSSSRYYTVSSSGSIISAGAIQLNYDANDATGISVADNSVLRIAQSSGSNWNDLGPVAGGSANSSGNITSTTNFTSLGDFVLANTCVNPTISTQPSATTSFPGTAVNPTFTVATSTVGATFQWQYSANGTSGWANVSNGTPANFTYTNATTATLTIATTTSASVGTYFFRAVVSSGASCVTNTDNNIGLTLSSPSTPTITTISPNSVFEGNGAFTLTVNGTNFINGISTVNWNGVARTTTFVNSTQLTAAIPATDVQFGTGGTTPSVTVSTSGASNSNSATFTIDAQVSPALSATPISGFGSLTVGQTATGSFTLSGSNLTVGSTVTITAPTGFSVSPSTISVATATISQLITVTFAPTLVQSYNSNISYSSGEVAAQNLAVTGSGIALTAPTSLSITHISDNIQRLAWTAPSGTYDKVLVFAVANNATACPVSGAGSSYTGANANFSAASTYSSVYSLVYAGTGTSIEVTGLTNATTYNYTVVSYSGSIYSTPLTPSATTLLSPVTGLSATSANASSVVTWTNPSFNGTQANYWDEVMVVVSTSAVSTPSGNGSAYTANAAYGSGTAYGSGFVVYEGTGTTVTVSALTNLTAYIYSVFVRHGSTWSAVTTATATPIPYAAGDLVSVATGSYSNATTWNTWSGTALTAGSVPSASTNVWIVNGNVVTTAAAACKDLHVINGRLTAGVTTSTANSNILLSVSGSIIEVTTNGILGTNTGLTGGNIIDPLAINIPATSTNTTVTITGSGGIVNINRIINALPASTIVIDRDVILNYHGSGHGGNASAYHSTATSNTLTINSGATLTFAPWACYIVNGSSTTVPTAPQTINVNGTMTFTSGNPTGVSGVTSATGWTNHASGYFTMAIKTGAALLNVGTSGIINFTQFYPNGTTQHGSNTTDLITINNSGIINIADTSDFSKVSSANYQTITGTGTVNITAGQMSIGHTTGITTSGATGPIQTTTRNYGTGVTYSYAGSAAQVTGNGLPATVAGLSVNNSTGLTLSAATTVANRLTLTSGLITTTSSNILTLGASATYSGGSNTSYVSGPVQNSLATTSSTALNFPIGKANLFSPATLTVTQSAATATTYKAEVFTGSGLSRNLPVALNAVSSNRYYTLSSNASNISTASLTLAYDATDAVNNTISVTTAANIRVAGDGGSSDWDDLGGTGSASLSGTITSSNNFTALGNFVIANALVLGTAPTLTAAVGATVDANFNITFPDDLTWRNAITSVKYGSTTLTVGTDYSISAGVITLKPSGSALSGLRTAGTQTVTVIATDYNDGAISQTIGVGAAAKLIMKTQPTAPTASGGVLVTQPAVFIQDQYGNLTTSTATVTANVGAGTWTIGGTNAVAATSGTTTFSGLTATAGAAVTGATITFTASGLTSVTSNSFNIPGPVTYYWVGGITSAAWNTAVWSTTKGGTAVTGFTPSSTDIFIFDGSNIGAGATGAVTVSTTTNYTIGQLIIQNNANVTISQSGSRTININGLAGSTDFVVGAGSTLTSTGSANTIALLTGATGSISGTVTLGSSSNAHIITVADVNGLTVNSGANVISNPGSYANAFGTGTSGSVIFASGATFTNTKGGDPFGGSGKNVVTFQTGSTYELQHNNSSSLDFNGRTFSNFIFNAASNASSVSLTGTFTVDDLTIAQKNLTINETGATVNVKGDISIAASSALIFNPTTASSLILNATTGAQSITNAGTFTVPALQTLNINNASGVTLSSAITFTGTLSLTAGKVTLGAFNLSVGSTSGGSASSYVDASGAGRFIITAVPVTATTFPIGTSSSYAPITLTGGTAGRNITTGVKAALTNAPLVANNVVNLEWSILASASTSPTVTFQYNTANRSAGYTGTSPVLGVYASSAYTEVALGSVSGSNPFTVATSAVIALPTSAASLYAVGNTRAFSLSVPGAPTAATATAGNAQASVSFTAPVDNGGAAITLYTVTSSPGSKTGTGSSSPIVVTGLTNGTAYTFTVKATNSIGQGAASTASNSVTPATVPGAPTSVVGTAGNAQASVSFTAPVSNGGAAITSYTVTSSPGGVTASGANSPLVVTGLTNGTAYTFTVTATNTAGTGTASTASSSVTPKTVPDAPTDVDATSGNATAIITFTAPVDNGGSIITGYTVTSNPGNLTVSGASSPLTITGLTNGTAYTFTVVASNVVGSSAASVASDPVTPSSSTTWNGFAWSSGLPNSTLDGIINGNLTTAVAYTFKNLTVNSNFTYTSSAAINVVGSTIINNGTIKGTGTVNLNGTTLQSVSGIGTINNLTINNSAGARVISGSNKLNLTGLLTLQLGVFTTNGNLVLKSTSITNSATLAPVGISGNNGSISGTVQVERFIPKGYRAWRDMAPSVFNAGSIFNNWQETGSYANNGYGLFITGTTAATNAHAIDATTGLDQSVNSVKSAYTFTNGTWSAITNTKTTNLNPFLGYRLLVRGDRSFNLYTTPISTVGTTGMLLMVNSTTLRATGNLITGNVVFGTSGITNSVAGATYNSASFGLNSSSSTGFSSVANPYVAPIDWKNIWDNNRAVNLTANYYYLDPTIGSTGAYVSYNALTDATSNGALGTRRYIQAGQAFFVENNGSTAPSLTITESDKAISTTKTSVFGNASRSRLAISLIKATGTEMKVMDAATVVFDEQFSNEIAREDAKKMTNPGENLAINHGAQSLSIEGRLPATADERLPLSLSQLATSEYQLSIDATAYKADNMAVYLVDALDKSETLLTASNNNISFKVDASNVATYANRFSVVFKAASKAATTTAPIAAASLSVYPNPVVGKTMAIRLGNNIASGKYVVRMYNSLGQQVHTSFINHVGANAATTITTANQLAAGAYKIQIVSSANNQVVATTNLAVE